MANGRKIGDYIHYYARNYSIYGQNRRPEGPSGHYNFDIQHQKIFSKLTQLQTMSEDERRGLQNTLKTIFSNATIGEGQQYIFSVQQEIRKKLIDLFGASLGKIDWEVGNVNGVGQGKKLAQRKIKDDEKDRNIQLSTILKRVKVIQQIRSSYRSPMEKQDLKNKIDKIYHELNDIIHTSKKGIVGELRSIVANSSIDKVIYPAEGVVRNQYIPTTSAQNIINSINDILSLYSGTPMVQKGDLFEYAIAAAPVVARKGAMSELKTAFKNVKGGERTHVQINFDDFTEAVNLKDLDFIGKGYSLSGNTVISWGTSQNKIDVDLEWGGKNLGVSAKNINLKSGYNVHLLSGSSLLFLLQDEDPSYVNHYLNLIADHPDYDKYGLSHFRQSADIATKLTLLYKGLTGDVYKRQKAEIFIVNDNSSNNVWVFNMSDLIQKASQNIDQHAEITANGADISTIRLVNNWNDSNYSARITQLLSNAHAQKISVAFKPQVLDAVKIN